LLHVLLGYLFGTTLLGGGNDCVIITDRSLIECYNHW